MLISFFLRKLFLKTESAVLKDYLNTLLFFIIKIDLRIKYYIVLRELQVYVCDDQNEKQKCYSN